MKIKRIKPLFSCIITTADYEDEVYTAGGLIDVKKSGSLKDIQKLVFIGDQATARGLKEGDLVKLSWDRYKHKVTKRKPNSVVDDMTEEYGHDIEYSIPLIDIGGKDYCKLDLMDIIYVIEDYEDDIKKEDSDILIVQNSELLN